MDKLEKFKMEACNVQECNKRPPAVVVVVVVDIISPNVGTPRLRVEQFGV